MQPAPIPNRHPRLGLALTAITLAVFAWSGIAPYERFTWVLEVAPVCILLPLIYLVRGPFPLSPLLMVLLCLHGVILMVGGKYTYARVPIGFTVADWLGWQRNPYDRLGHLAQGFVPALIAREVLLRTSPLVRGKWLAFLCVSIALAFSALYELIEWQAAVWTGEAAESFLGTQGDEWDTQWDMALALMGAIASLLLLRKAHDRSLGLAD
ncbi:MAG: DUF2238 domain-containing protein [Planctomycetota bacterium]